MMFPHLFLVIFLFFSVLEQSLADFPFSEQGNALGQPKKAYRLELNNQFMRFFNEEKNRHQAGLKLDIHQSFTAIKARYIYSFAEKHHYFRLPEAALRLNSTDGVWFIGRKLKNWDWADSFWNRGIWEPLYREDALRTYPAGLTGFFRDFDYAQGQFSLFGSFLFLPELGPHFEEKEGALVSKNSWFTSPPVEKIGNTNMKPFYDIQDKAWQDFLKLSLGGRLSYRGFYASYLYKPMNRFLLKSHFSISLKDKPKGSYKKGYRLKIPIEPMIVKHHLAGLGWEWEGRPQGNSGVYGLKLSVNYSRPVDSLTDSEKKEKDLIYFSPQKEYYFSAKGEFKTTGSSKEQSVFHLAYTHLLSMPGEKNVVDKIFTGESSTQFFQDNLLKFDKAMSLGFDYSTQFDRSAGAGGKARLIYDFDKRYFLFSFEASLTLAYSLTGFVSGDYFFSKFPFSISQTAEDVGIYANKSRFFGGLKYAF